MRASLADVVITWREGTVTRRVSGATLAAWIDFALVRPTRPRYRGLAYLRAVFAAAPPMLPGPAGRFLVEDRPARGGRRAHQPPPAPGRR